jgi:hypothetical protein
MATHSITTTKNIDELAKLGSVASLAWSRTTTTASITQANHGYVAGSPFYVTTTSDALAITTGAKTVLGITSSSVFTVTCLNGGAASGTVTLQPLETYNIDGGALTIDQDTRVGLNQNTTAIMGNITISATLGGSCTIDGSAVWMIPYSSGTGNVPAWNTAITQSGQSGTGKLIGVHSALTAASTATGAVMPATGFLRVKQKSGTYVAGALTGISASADDAGRTGWLEVVGCQTFGVIANRLGSFNVNGAWYKIGTTTGSSNQTMQIPNNGLLRHIPGVYIEKTAGQADYEFYPNNGTLTTTGTEATRGKVVWIDNTGLVRIGNSGAATNGYTPVTGLSVVIGNVFLQEAAQATPTANIIPHATVGSRYDFTTTGGGVVNMNYCAGGWYLSCTQPYSVNITNSCFTDSVNLQEVASPMTWTLVGIGNKATTQLVAVPFNMLYCFAGGTFTNCNFQLATMASTGGHVAIMTDCSDFDFVGCTFRAGVIRANATTYNTFGTRLKNFTFTNHTQIQGANQLVTCDGVDFTDTIFCDVVSGTTATYADYVWNLSLNTINCIFSGLTIPVANTNPYTALLYITTGCANIKLRNIGTYASPLNMGPTSACGNILNIPASGACSDIKLQRIYCSNTRLNGIYYASATSPDNSSNRILIENVFTDYADTADLNNMLNITYKGIGCVPVLTAATGIYGTHFYDCHSSTTAGRIAIMMNEPTSLTSSQVTLTGGAGFTALGGLYMPTVGQTATFEIPHYIIGHTGFTDTAAVMAGGTATDYTYEYSIDKNDGGGWSTMTSSSYTATQLGTALSGISGISAINGFKLKIKITTGTTNTTAITSLYLVTISSTTTQAYQYPLDTITLTLTGISTGSDVVVYAAGTTTVRQSNDAISGTTQTYVYSTQENVDIGVFKSGMIPFYIRAYPLASNNASLPVSQVIDRAYLE